MGERALSADATRDDLLILVDGKDRELGSATKLKTHVEGLLHRAFSVVLVRDGEGGPEMLLARRALGKYHSGGLWANTCCSHPRVGEATMDAAYRRVSEELGCRAVDLRELCAFAYRAEFESGLCEYEYDHVFVGRCEGDPSPDPAEVDAVRWVGFDAVAAELASDPRAFAAWAPMVLTMAMSE
ncbi:MAG TPA: isopentenyl-diphosphate Delta-isomerase [Eggerthellaceae bacterium]|nr:isopentenyl-diphosphate Delta-isomerase [Eggerthellaceae bacterium]